MSMLHLKLVRLYRDILKGEVIRISPQVKQRKVLSTDPTGDADARIIEVLVKLDEESINLVKNYFLEDKDFMKNLTLASVLYKNLKK